MAEQCDAIVIASGPGGASLAQALAPTEKHMLILERGEYLPREEANRSAQAVFVDGRYPPAETWANAKGGAISPQLLYFGKAPLWAGAEHREIGDMRSQGRTGQRANACNGLERLGRSALPLPGLDLLVDCDQVRGHGS